MSEYKAIYICGYCRKKTPMSDELTEKVIMGDAMEHAAGVCECGHFSYASTIKAKFKADFSKWRCYTSSIK